MPKVMDRIARWFETEKGRRFLEDAEREEQVRDDRFAERRAAVAAIETSKLREKEELPPLYAAAQQAREALDVAREHLRKTQGALTRVARDADHRRDEIARERRRAEGLLRNTCDPRIQAAHDVLTDAAHNWHHAANDLMQFEVRGEGWDAHQVATNRDEVFALKTRIDTALERVDALMFVAEPGEAEVVAAAAEARAAADPVLKTVRRHYMSITTK